MQGSSKLSCRAAWGLGLQDFASVRAESPPWGPWQLWQGDGFGSSSSVPQRVAHVFFLRAFVKPIPQAQKIAA